MDRVFTARVVMPERQYPDAGSRARFAAALQERIAALPAVRSATLTTVFPGLSADRTAVAVDGQDYEDGSRYPVVRMAAIAPRFFETFERALLAGRDFTTADGPEAPRVAIVNSSFARQVMAGADPLGRRIRPGRSPDAPWLTVVGVAPDLYLAGAENIDPAGIYVPLAQNEPRSIGLAALVAGAPMALVAPVRAEVSALDRDMPVYAPNSLRRAVDDSMWAVRVFGPLLVVVGAAALFLATVGLYSLMAFAMRQRRREIGLRMALGARPAQVARLVWGQVSREVTVGLLAGGALAAGVARAGRAMFFHVQAGDPFTYGAVTVALVLAAALAAVVPVRRAVRVDPIVTLRDT